MSKASVISLDVLVVEDEQVIHELIGRVLREPTFRLSGATTVGQGLRLIKQGRFDLLITDLRLPDGTGLEIIRNFRGMAPDIPIIVITGSLTPEERLGQVSEFKIFTCLEKPFDVTTFKQIVEQALGVSHV